MPGRGKTCRALFLITVLLDGHLPQYMEAPPNMEAQSIISSCGAKPDRSLVDRYYSANHFSQSIYECWQATCYKLNEGSGRLSMQATSTA